MCRTVSPSQLLFVCVIVCAKDTLASVCMFVPITVFIDQGTTSKGRRPPVVTSTPPLSRMQDRPVCNKQTPPDSAAAQVDASFPRAVTQLPCRKHTVLQPRDLTPLPVRCLTRRSLRHCDNHLPRLPLHRLRFWALSNLRSALLWQSRERRVVAKSVPPCTTPL